MAILTGIVVASGIGYQVGDSLFGTSSLPQLDLSGSQAFDIGDDILNGTLTVGTPVALTPAVLTGNIVTSFINDYYDRIHISPILFDFGNLSSLAQRQFNVWNAWRTNVTVTNVEYVGSDGWSIAGFLPIGGSMLALDEVTYTLTMTPEGPPIINGGVSVAFSTGDAIVLGVVGRRVVLFPFMPNWKTQFNETLEWSTDVLRAWDGTEQRRSLRITPRRSFEYNFLAHDRMARKLDALLWTRMHRTFALPVWTDGTKLTANVAADAYVLPCLTQYTGLRIDDVGVLFVDDKTFEIFEVANVTSTQVTTKNPVVAAWAAGTSVFPVVFAQQEAQAPMVRHTDNTIVGKVMFLAAPAGSPLNITSAAAPTTYDGLEVITVQPDWGDAISNGYAREMLVADGDTGIVVYFDKETNTRLTRPFRWLLKNKAEIAAFRSFLLRMNGQMKTCWIPSWHDDLTIIGTTANTEAFIDIETEEYAEAASQGVDLMRDRLMIKFNDGTHIYRKVIGATKNATYTRLTLDSVVGRQIAPEDVYRVRFMLKCRIASDKIVIPWYTDSIARPQLVFTTTKA